MPRDTKIGRFLRELHALLPEEAQTAPVLTAIVTLMDKYRFFGQRRLAETAFRELRALTKTAPPARQYLIITPGPAEDLFQIDDEELRFRTGRDPMLFVGPAGEDLVARINEILKAKFQDEDDPPVDLYDAVVSLGADELAQAGLSSIFVPARGAFLSDDDQVTNVSFEAAPRAHHPLPVQARMSDPALQLWVDDDAWEPIGAPADDPRSRLLATISLNGVLFHAEAIAVVETDDGAQRAADPEWEERLDELAGTFQPEGGWQTLSIAGRDYVVFLDPYSL